MTLTEFLLARIADLEALARAARAEMFSPDGAISTGDDPWPSELAFAEHVTPARVLAECEAKRRIVEVVSGWKHITVEDCWYSCAATYGTEVEGACCNDSAEGVGCDCGLEHRVASIIGALALPYADHPDFDESWRP